MKIHPADLCGIGIAAADDILKSLGLPVSKALNPLLRRDFIIITGRLARKLKAAAGVEEIALGEALRTLDVDWAGMTAKQRDRVFDAARIAIRRSIPDATDGVVGVLIDEVQTIAGTTRSALRARHKFDIEVNFSTTDREILEHSAESQGNFVSNAIGERADDFDQQARVIVTDGLLRGSGRKEIAGRLQKGLERAQLDRQKSYYEVVAGSMTNRSRTFGQMASFRDAAITVFVIESVLDEATSHICRYMHGRRFQVDDGVGMFEQVEQLSDPQEIKDVQPWVRTRQTADGGQVLQLQSGGKVQTVARVLESAVGRSDQVGRFTGGMSNAQLAKAGVMTPPFHAFCRTTVVPDV